MPGDGLKWTFQQLGGDKKQIELSGYLAPFGRPRQKPLMKEVIKSRVQTTVYPGSKGPPTRHAFGTNWEPMELSGRWMTKTFTNGDISQGRADANALAVEWTEFVRDEQLVRMSWGWIISYTVFIEELELARESEHEIAWRMKVLVDKRDDMPAQKAVVVKAPIADDITDINTFLKKTDLLKKPNIPDMSFDFFDQLDFAAGQLNQFSAQMNKLAGKLGDIEKATFSTLQHFRGAIAGMRQAVLTLREVILDAKIDAETLQTDLQNSTFITKAILTRSPESDIRWAQYASNFDIDSLKILALLRAMELKVDVVAKSDASKFVTAEEGDTWESLTVRATGDLSLVGKVRSLNGAHFGDRPEPGQSYLIP